MSRSMSAQTWLASCFFRRRRGTSALTRRVRWERGCRAGRRRWRLLSMPTMHLLDSNRRQSCGRIFCNFTARKNPNASVGDQKALRLPVMKAIAVETKSDLAAAAGLCHGADRLLFDARRPRGDAAGGLGSLSTGRREKRPEWALTSDLGKPFDWSLLEQVDPGCAVHACRAGLMQAMSAEALRITAAPGG